MDKNKLQNIYENHPLIKEVYDRINSKLRTLPSDFKTESLKFSLQTNLVKTTTETFNINGKKITHTETEYIKPTRIQNTKSMVYFSSPEFAHIFYDTEDGGFIWRVYGDSYDSEYYIDEIVYPEDVQPKCDFNFRKLFFSNFNLDKFKLGKYGDPIHRTYDCFLELGFITEEEHSEIIKFIDKIAYLALVDIEEIDKQISELQEKKKKIEEEVKEIESSLV